MTTRTRGRSRLLLATLLTVTSAHAAHGEEGEGFHATLGFRTGWTSGEIAGQFEGDTHHVGPIAEIAWGDVSLGVALQFANFDEDVRMPFPMPEMVRANGGPGSLVIPAAGETSRSDIDVSLRYRLNRYLTPFVGYRREAYDVAFRLETTDPEFQAQLVDVGLALLQGVAAGTVSTSDAAEFANGGLGMDRFETTLDLDILALGANVAYPLDEIGLVPFAVGTVYAFGMIGEQESAFPGYSIEGGAAYLLGRHFDLPVYVTGSIKWQTLESDGPLEELDEVLEGASEAFPVEQTYLNYNLAVFYRFEV